MPTLTESFLTLDEEFALAEQMDAIYREVKDSTMSYRFGPPTEAHELVTKVYGIPYYYSRETNVTVFAQDLRWAQTAAERG